MEQKLLCTISPVIFFELPKNKGMLQLQDIALLDKLPKTYVTLI